jgi:hypothetical protein
MKNLTLAELEILLDDCQKLSYRALSDGFLEENVRGNTRQKNNISTNPDLIVAGGEFVYGIPMADVDVLIAVLIELILERSK